MLDNAITHGREEGRIDSRDTSLRFAMETFHREKNASTKEILDRAKAFYTFLRLGRVPKE